MEHIIHGVMVQILHICIICTGGVGDRVAKFSAGGLQSFQIDGYQEASVAPWRMVGVVVAIVGR